MSKANCHCMGLDSIMLLYSPGKTIRLFIANPNHEMDNNHVIADELPLTIAFHSHHCAVTLHVIDGWIMNQVIEPIPPGHRPDASLQAYKYQSAIKDGVCRFVPHLIGHFIRSPRSAHLSAENTAFMAAHEIHTVGVMEGHRAAWFVFEGVEDPNYSSLCYSNADLANFDAAGMYLPMTESQIEKSLSGLWL